MPSNKKPIKQNDPATGEPQDDDILDLKTPIIDDEDDGEIGIDEEEENEDPWKVGFGLDDEE